VSLSMQFQKFRQCFLFPLTALAGAAVFSFAAGTAHACTGPAGDEGDMRYASNYKTMVFCNGDNWVSMAGGGSDTLSGLTCSTDQIAKYDGSQWVCTDQTGGDGSATSFCPDPTSGLTVDQTEGAGTFGNLEDATQPATFHARVTFPGSPSGVIFESGANGQGMALWADGNMLYFGAGDGSTSTTNNDGVIISTDISAYTGQTVDIVAAVDPDTGEAALYIDDCWQVSGAASGGGLQSGEWAGTDGAGYGQVNSGVRDPAPGSSFNGTLVSDLSFYENELPAGFPDDNETQSVSDLSGLTCSTDQIARYDGSQWVCADGAGGGGGRTSCPSGYSLIGTPGTLDAFCISTNEQGGGGGGGEDGDGVSWLQALTACYNKTPRQTLCSVQQWTMACVSGLPNNMTNNKEWVADAVDEDKGGAANMGDGRCDQLRGTSEYDFHVYRCCMR
jgi:hypothetical protein